MLGPCLPFLSLPQHLPSHWVLFGLRSLRDLSELQVGRHLGGRLEEQVSAPWAGAGRRLRVSSQPAALSSIYVCQTCSVVSFLWIEIKPAASLLINSKCHHNCYSRVTITLDGVVNVPFFSLNLGGSLPPSIKLLMQSVF